MPRRILVIVGHPDPAPERLSRALADAYAEGAAQAGHELRRIDIAGLDIPPLRTTEEFEQAGVPESLRQAAEAVTWAEHIVFVFPLWLGTMPALLKSFLEQVMRPGTAFAYSEGGGFAKPLLKGRSARVVVTMAMPGPIYRFWFLDHGIAGMRRNILNFVGIKPVRETLFGLVHSSSDAKRAGWMEKMRKLGRAAS